MLRKAIAAGILIAVTAVPVLSGCSGGKVPTISGDTTAPVQSETSVLTESKEEISAVPEDSGSQAQPQSDYFSYLGEWLYTQVPEDAEEKGIPQDQYISTVLDFKEINGDEARFELYKGNVKFVADTFVTAQIINGKIDFEYEDALQGKGHGTITLNGDSVHVYCTEDEHGTGRISLDCDEDLIRK